MRVILMERDHLEFLPDQTATTMIGVFGRLGYPLEIFTDKGKNFGSELFKSVCDLLHIHKARTTPCHPSSNIMVRWKDLTGR